MGRIVIYLRLSKEDDLIKDESNSISNQRDYILEYIRKDKLLRQMEVVEIKDDGYSGKNMDRPGMQNLLESIRKQQVDCIIVKDMSRFSRDYLTLGQYTEQIFPFMRIRFIAIDDGYDSDTCTGGIGEIDVAFKALLYDFYSEDLSMKVKTSIRSRKEEGHFMNRNAPYGYLKDGENRHKLLIDPVGEKVIKRIFSEYASGKSIYRIAQELNQDGIPSPAKYIEDRDRKKYFSKEEYKLSWNMTSISRILRNEIYCGNAIYNKFSSPVVAAKHSQLNDKEEWKRVEKVFPAIIEKELFDAIQKKLQKNEKIQKVYEDHVLKGKVVCGGCKHKMFHSRAGANAYHCNTRYRSKVLFPNCVTSIRDVVLENMLLQLIREKIQGQIAMKDVIQEKKERQKLKIAKAKDHLKEMNKSFEKFEMDQFQSYEDYKSGVIEKETFLQQKHLYEEMIQELEKNMELQRVAIEQMEEDQCIPDGWCLDSECLQLQSLDRTIVDLLIQKVVIHQDHTVEVYWNMKE